MPHTRSPFASRRAVEGTAGGLPGCAPRPTRGRGLREEGRAGAGDGLAHPPRPRVPETQRLFGLTAGEEGPTVRGERQRPDGTLMAGAEAFLARRKVPQSDTVELAPPCGQRRAVRRE